MSMITSTLDAKSRTSAGKGSARRTRMTGLVPAVVYGKALEKPLNIAVDAKMLKAAIHTPKKLNTIISLKLEGGARTVLLKEYQIDPVSHDLVHADFIDVRENEQVKVRVPVVLTGKPEGVLEGGILSHMKRELEVMSLPASIPEAIEVDVTPLKIGGSIHVNELKLPAGLKVKGTINYTIAVVTAPEIEKAPEPVAALPGAEGAVAAAPGAPGAAPGAPGAAPAAGAPGAPGAAPAAGAPAPAAPAPAKGKK